MPLNREQRERPARARPRPVALTCALVVLGILIPAAPAAAGPLLLTAPSLDRAGRALTTTQGSWFPANNAYAYGWERCDAAVVVCTAVPGRMASSYLLTSADIGKRIRSVVTATNALLPPPATAASDATGPIAASPPLNVTPPSASGSGSTVTSTLGTWSDPNLGSVSYTRQWQQCAGADGLSCQNVSGQAGATYTLTQADEGKFIRVVVTAEGLGQASVASAPLGPIMPLSATGGETGGGTGGKGDSTPTLRKLRPFPKVIIAGRLARGLTFISGLVIRRGPKGAHVAVTCRGRGCPKGGRFRGKLDRSGSLKLKRFQRIYGTGSVLEIRITKRGAIGKYTRIMVKARSIPGRRDSCLKPGISKPSRCP